MVQSLFNINSYTLTLSSPPPSVTSSFNITASIQGVTRVVVNYNLLNFTVKPFKAVIIWPFQDPIALNGSFSTLSTINSAFSYTVIAPPSIDPVDLPSSILLYYENGVIHTFNITFKVYSDNIIDMDLNVLNIQNTDQNFGTVYNLQSNRDNVVFNSTDNILLSGTEFVLPSEGATVFD